MRFVAALATAAVLVMVATPVTAQGSEPRVNITRWSNGRTTLAILFGSIINGVTDDDFFAQFNPNLDVYFSAAAAPMDAGVSLTFDTDPPLATGAWLAYNDGTGSDGGPATMLVFDIVTDPSFNWAGQGSVLLQAHSGDTRLPDPLNRAFAPTDIVESPDPAADAPGDVFEQILTETGWILTSNSDPLVLVGDGSSGTVGELLTPSSPVGDNETPTGSQDTLVPRGEPASPSQSSTPQSTAPTDSEPAAVKVASDQPSTTSESGGGSSLRGFAIAGVVALAVLSLFTWRIRSKVLEGIANPTKPGPDDADWTKPKKFDPEQQAYAKGGCNFVMRMVGRVLGSTPNDMGGLPPVPTFDETPQGEHGSTSNGDGKSDDDGDGFIEIEV